jgi:hypothetical protein
MRFTLLAFSERAFESWGGMVKVTGRIVLSLASYELVNRVDMRLSYCFCHSLLIHPSRTLAMDDLLPIAALEFIFTSIPSLPQILISSLLLLLAAIAPSSASEIHRS